jgi:hypothetical protein
VCPIEAIAKLTKSAAFEKIRSNDQALGVRKLACAFDNVKIIKHLKAAASCRTPQRPTGADYPNSADK